MNLRTPAARSSALRPRFSLRQSQLLGWKLIARCLAGSLLLLAFAGAAAAQSADRLDSRDFQFRQLLRQLNTTARLMHTTAHPDDEDGPMLTLEARGHGADVLLLTLTRGEGGQNRMGGSLLDSLGVLRTLELLAADRYYGVAQRFTRVADFGFSKSPDETFEKWHGHDAALADLVRVIRTFRPDVLISRFRGAPPDGHGHHQAAGILTREAFRAAADPARFPEQIQEGLLPWQVKKLYIGNLRFPGAPALSGQDGHLLQLDTGADDPLLGASYAQFAMQGLKHQLSQGAGTWSLPAGPRLGYYLLVASALPPAPGREQDFFDGIDTSLVGLAARLGSQAERIPELRRQLERMQADVDQARAATRLEDAAAPLLDGYEVARALLGRLAQPDPGLPPLPQAELQTAIETKRDQFARAASLALGISLEATASTTAPAPSGFMAVRGATFPVSVTVTASSPELLRGQLDLAAPPGWKISRSAFAGGSPLEARFTVTVADDAPYTRPCISRRDERQTVYTLASDDCAVLPLPPPPLHATFAYSYAGHEGLIASPVEVIFTQEDGSLARRPLAVAPKFSVASAPATRIVRSGAPQPFAARISASSNFASQTSFTFAPVAPAGWTIKTDPSAAPADLCPRATAATAAPVSCQFHFAPPPHTPDGEYLIRAGVVQDGARYDEGYSLITRPDLASALYYAPATIKVSTVDVKLPQELKIGYVMGSGDDIPEILTQLGLNLKLLSDDELSAGNLAAYDTIVLGIRAYDTREAVRRANRRLLDFVAAGGTLVVQYNSGAAEFNAGGYTPYPTELGHERVTDEDAAVTLLAPDSPLLRYPNPIGAADFRGWVQERGLYFMTRWDPHFQPLLAAHDPGEEPLPGGLLAARYGKGMYLYTGYSFFRQLPAGVPGAVRLFVNLLSAGHVALPVQ